MVKMCELSINARGLLMDDINKVMTDTYNVDRESVKEFWEAFALGMDMRRRA